MRSEWDFFVLGGGISNRGTLTLIDSLVTENEGDLESEDYVNMPYAGGGIYNIGTLTLIRSTGVRPRHRVPDDEGDQHPGRWAAASTTPAPRPWWTRSSPTTTRTTGRWIKNTGTMTLRRSTVSDNDVQWGLNGPVGGGIDNSGALILVDSRVTGNGGYDGGGIGNAGTVRLRDSTVTANTANDRGGGIFNDASGTVTFRGTASVTGNTPDDCVGTPAC